MRSILTRIDPYRRYRIDSPAVDGPKTPAEVFAQCLEIRGTINDVRRELELGTTPVPSVAEGQALRPEDVFIQTQIIIAELNLVKLGTGTSSSTPLTVPVSDKTPSDVFGQAALLDYLLKQIKPLRRLVAQAGQST